MITKRKYPKYAMLFHAYTDTIERSYKEIEDYLAELDRYFNSKQQNVIDFVNELCNDVESEEEKSEIAMHYADDFDRYNQTYPGLMLHSTFIASYSKFESLFAQICKTTERIINSKVKVKDLNDKGIQQYRKYLLKVAEIEFSELNNDWANLLDYQKIRNLIVHHHADYKINPNNNLESQPMHPYIANNENIKIRIEGTGYFQIFSTKYILEFGNCAGGFLKGILSNTYQRWKQEH